MLKRFVYNTQKNRYKNRLLKLYSLIIRILSLFMVEIVQQLSNTIFIKNLAILNLFLYPMKNGEIIMKTGNGYVEKSHSRFSFMEDIKTYNWNIENYMRNRKAFYIH